MPTVLDFLDPMAFLIAFSVGLFAMMLKDPVMNVVIKYPTPYNINEVYKGESGDCYKYRMVATECNGSSKEIPMYQSKKYID